MVRGSRIWLTVAALCLSAVPSQAQFNPQRQITVVVPIGAGGGVDATGRLFAEKLAERLKQSVVVENKTGAGGLVGTDYVAKAAPDGHTILVMESSAVLHKWLHKSVPFDTIADFTPVARVAISPLILIANPSFAPNSVRELIALAKEQPGKLSAGTPGIGTPHHLALLMLNALAKVDIVNVPYRGAALALNDVLAGQIPMSWAAPTAVMPHVAAGKVKALGVASGTPRARTAGHSDHRRERRAGLRSRNLLWYCRAVKDAAGGGRTAVEGNRRDFGAAGRAGAHPQVRARAVLRRCRQVPRPDSRQS